MALGQVGGLNRRGRHGGLIMPKRGIAQVKHLKLHLKPKDRLIARGIQISHRLGQHRARGKRHRSAASVYHIAQQDR